jgi:hypothetical protein
MIQAISLGPVPTSGAGTSRPFEEKIKLNVKQNVQN